MVKLGFLFPGQGAQTVGMGRDIYESSPRARTIFDRANTIIGSDVTNLCFNGPEETLKQTVNAQVAIFTTSIALLEGIKERYPQLTPSINCGLSLGEYSALVSAGVLDFTTALRIVKRRGEIMEHAAQANPGGMVSIIGLAEAVCREIARECDVDVANYNSPRQSVLSGMMEQIEKAREVAMAKGAKKAVVLNVSGAFHSRLMEPAAGEMQQVLADIDFQVPQSGFIPNVTATSEDNGEKIKNNLVHQVSRSVQWTQTMQYSVSQGVKHFLEIGPGKVLKGLARRINKEIIVISCETVEHISDIETLFSVTT